MPESLECPSDKFLEFPTAQVLFECAIAIASAVSISGVRVSDFLECFWSRSASVSQSASQSVGVQWWFSKLISTLRALIFREGLIL